MNTILTLKASYIKEVQIKNPSYAKKLINRRNEVLFACLLTQVYCHFTVMMLHRSLSITKSTYDEAEKSAKLCTFLFGKDIKPADTMHHQEKEANEAINEYKLMCDYIAVLEQFEVTKEDILSFCKQVEYGSGTGLSWFKFQCNTHYKVYTEALLSYLFDLYSYEEMKESFFEYSVLTKKRTPAKVRRFIRDLRKALDVFYSIYQKKFYRKQKQFCFME